MSRVRDDEIAHWLREAAEETQPTDPIPVPAQQQHPQQRDIYLEDDPDHADDTD